jgi:hypothetical protein
MDLNDQHRPESCPLSWTAVNKHGDGQPIEGIRSANPMADGYGQPVRGSFAEFAASAGRCGNSGCQDRFFGFLGGKIVRRSRAVEVYLIGCLRSQAPMWALTVEEIEVAALYNAAQSTSPPTQSPLEFQTSGPTVNWPVVIRFGTNPYHPTEIEIWNTTGQGGLAPVTMSELQQWDAQIKTDGNP